MNTETAKKCWSANNEEFNCDSLSELLDNTPALVLGNVVYVGEAVPPNNSDLVDAGDVIDQMADRASEIAGDYADDYPGVTSEAKAELNALLSAWIDKHAKPTFYTVQNVREYVLTKDDMEPA